MWREYCCLWPRLIHLFCYIAVRHIARVFLNLAWFNSSLLSYGLTLYGASIIVFGLGYLVFAIAWLYVVRREYYCIWPGLIHLCYHMAVPCKARVLLPLAWVDTSLLSYGRMPDGASIIAFCLGYLIFAIHDCASYGASIIAFGFG